MPGWIDMSDENQKKKKDDLEGLEAVSFRAGEIVEEIIDNAIRSADYSSLSRQVTEALERAADALHDGLTNAVRGKGGEGGSGKKSADIPYWQREESRSYRSSTRSGYDAARSKAQRGSSDLKETADYLAGSGGVASPVGSYIKAALQMIWAFISGMIFIASLAVGPGGGMWLFSIFSALFAALMAVLGVRNLKKISRIKLARKILKLMAGRDYISVDEISSAIGKDHDKTAEELRGMIQDNVFTGQAYLDRQNTTFMTSHETYQQYQALEKSRAERMKQENESVFRQKDLKEYNKMQEGKKAREQSEAKRSAQMDRETQQMLEEGQAFIRHIHEKNDEIPGEEFSEKLDRLEQIVTGIFQRVEADPKSAPDLHRMMKYYLPTTQKLVDTYATLDSQNISGANVENAKREIERSLDTINSAFERFLDQFFKDTAWDVSSDISVMGTMMAQDGLTGGDDFSEEKIREYTAASAQESRQEKSFEEEHGYTEGYTRGYSDTLGSGAAYAEAPDREGKG